MVALWLPCLCDRDAPAADEALSERTEFFEKAIRPLLAEHCHECHGDQKQEGGLRLTSRATLLRGGDSGPAVVPGEAEVSPLIRAVGYLH